MTQSLILSGFFYGYLIPQIPAGWISGRFGGKVTVGVCMGLASILTLLIPVLARLSALAVFTARVLIGIILVSSTRNNVVKIGSRTHKA